MAELLVHLHIYYHDQVDYFIEKLGNIHDVDWDLTVTYSEWNEVTANKLKAFKPDVKFMEVENFGYDIWPFIKIVKSTDLSDYKYVIKLHTKRAVTKCRPNIIKLKGYEWRNALVDGIINDRDHFERVLNLFREKKETGMVYSLLTSVKRDYYDDFVLKELKRIGIPLKEKATNMGAMFMIRSVLLKPLQSELITEDMFQQKPVSGSPLQSAHLYERIFSHLAINQGLKNIAITPGNKYRFRINLMNALKPIGKFLFCCEREGAGHRKFVRILGVRVYTGKDILFFDNP